MKAVAFRPRAEALLCSGSTSLLFTPLSEAAALKGRAIITYLLPVLVMEFLLLFFIPPLGLEAPEAQ